ncbi:ATP-binding protein [Isoptericola sp. 4D.3]|uniref:Sensor-like histidine kinase SenX3 n=1 Tax=Isoptericola peretonis TaxID=2918523 RepID=A0ABT0J2V1_9MICO|nr:ATP-binding protein [Isoptericola sp. 4D.3]
MSGGARRLQDTYDRVVAAWFSDDAVGLRQLPGTVSVAVVLVYLVFDRFEDSPVLLATSGLFVVAVQVAGSVGRWERWAQGWRYVLPLAQILAVGLLEIGSGLPLGSLDMLLFLPVVSLALQPGVGGLAAALLGSAVVLFVPALLPGAVVDRVPPALHAAVSLLIIGFVAVGAHGIVGVARGQARQLERARDDLALAARNLRDSRDTLQGILDAATEQGFVATDFAGRVVLASPGTERIVGRAVSELVGGDVAGLVSAAALAARLAEPGAPRAADAANRVVLGRAIEGEMHREDWEVVLPDGARRQVELTVTERPALSGRDPELPAGYLVVLTDVTARYEERRTQDEFIGLVSHELRTPLGSILGYLDLLRMEGDRLDPEQRDYLAVVERNARRLRTLVDDLLTSAQIVSGSYALTADDVDVVRVVQDAVTSVVPAAGAAGVEVVVDGDPAVPLVSDAERLGQVVDNLLSNAVKYSRRGGTVRITVTRGATPAGSRLARLHVVDEGFGISADELGRVTERFYRSRDTRRRHVRGAGLGLALVNQIVQHHGGLMIIRSEPGQGTEVDVTLPDLQPPNAAQE